MQLIVEAFVVGVLVVIFGIIAGFITRKMYLTSFTTTLPDVCRDYNKYHIMEVTLFLTGFLLHLFCELSGINRWYVANGVAAKSSTLKTK